MTDSVCSVEDGKIESMILKSVQEAVIATDLMGNITYWNEGACKLYGWEAREVMGRSILDVTPSEMSHDMAISVMESLGKGMCWTGQFTVRKRDGQQFQALVTDRPMLNDKKELVGIVGTSVDMHSEFVRHQIATSALAHELRAPVAGIIGMIEGMIDDHRVTLEDLETLHCSSHTLLNFINNLVDIPTAQSPAQAKTSTCNIGKVLQNVLNTMKPLGREYGISVSFSQSGEAPLIGETYVMKLQQAFFNVLSNAFKYTRPQSHITCVVFDSKEMEKFSFSPSNVPLKLDNPQNYVLVVVRDQGKGISNEDKTRLFKAYGTLEDKADAANHTVDLCGSTGLGLYNCQKLLKDIGGAIWVSWSEVGVGTEFVFMMPYTAATDPAVLTSLRIRSDTARLTRSAAAPNARDNGHGTKVSTSHGLTHEAYLSGATDHEERSSQLSRKRKQADVISQDDSSSDSSTTIVAGNDDSNANICHGQSANQFARPHVGMSLKLEVCNDILKRFCSQLNVTIFDDDPICRKVCQRLMQRMDLSPQLFRNGKEGLNWVVQRARLDTPVHIVFTDLNMPEMGGFECSLLLKQWFDQHPSATCNKPLVVALSSNTVEEMQAERVSNDIWMVETKPLTMQTLKRILIQAMPLLLLG